MTAHKHELSDGSTQTYFSFSRLSSTMRNAKLAAVLLLALTGGASAVLTEAECSTVSAFFTCASITETLTEATCDATVCAWDGSTCGLSPAMTTAYSALLTSSDTFDASKTAGEEACAAAANCEIPTTNTVAILTADGTYMTDNPNVCEEIGASCGVNSMWYNADECITSGYPIERLQASAGNSVGPATTLALACVSAAVAAFA